MHHPVSVIHALRRPQLLVTAARFALAEYRREVSLRLALRGHIDGSLPGPAAALDLLLEIEAGLEALRQRRDAAWCPARHVMVLGAVMAEARLVDAAARAVALAQVDTEPGERRVTARAHPVVTPSGAGPACPQITPVAAP